MARFAASFDPNKGLGAIAGATAPGALTRVE